MEDRNLKKMEQAFEAFEDTYDHLPEDHVFSADYLARRNRLLRRYRHKEMAATSRSGLRTAAAVAAVLVLGAGTVYAGVNGFRLRQNAPYQVDADLPETAQEKPTTETAENASAEETLQDLSLEEILTTDAAVKFDTSDAPVVELTVGWMPENLHQTDPQTSTKYRPYDYVDVDMHPTKGYYFDIFMMDSDAPIRRTGVVASETLTIGEHEATLFALSDFEDQTGPTNYELYIAYPEVQRIVMISAFGQTDRSELLEVASHLSFTEVEAHGENYYAWYDRSWGKYAAVTEQEMKTQAMLQEQAVAAIGRTVISADQMANLHEQNEAFCPFFDMRVLFKEEQGAAVDEDYIFPEAVRATVKDVKIADNISVLDKSDEIPSAWNGIDNEDGSIAAAVVASVNPGDGVNSLAEVGSPKEVPMKLLCATVEYTNTGKEDYADLYFYGGLELLTEDGGTWTTFVPEGLSEAESLELTAAAREMQYYDVPGQTVSKNYLPELKAGQTQIIHYAWLVPEESLGSIYLNLTGSPLLQFNGAGLTEEIPAEANIAAMVGLVDLNN